ncbi:DNA primase [Agaricicola taiwanensis]|uniref:DNA primase n=1 Tax=Agaricicola taiwanensis TaxID=591372 RepID=A0A8J2VSV5_9RHOB|nr:DNA primase [Agaricicola taiwanensis]GGE40887.1 DNA primase [Agaricicola taiwanensis]
MRFPPDFLDQIRARLPVSDVVGRRVKLRKQGREWAGLSPFNKEKTPSFFVNDQKGFYHDFSSGKHGDIFDFVMETEGLPFPEAVEHLAGMAGLQMPQSSPQDIQRERRRAGLGEVMDMAARFFEQAFRDRAGQNARTYVERRGLTAETIAKFRIGYAPGDRTALKRFLSDKGVPLSDQIEAGLLIAGDDIPEPYDRFRDRVMFPIEDARGKVIAFGGRALSADAPAKYLNSPDTPLFHKGTVVFNHHRARAAAHASGTVIAVEGYLDAIALDQAGIAHVVAPLGTALTPEQVGLLWRMSPEPILCFDGDKAGIRAAHRAVDTVLPLIGPGRSLAFAFLPDGQDPDDLVRGSGRKAMEDVLAAAKPLVEVLWTRELNAASLDTPERRAALDTRIGDLVREIKDENVRRHYASELKARLFELMPARGGQKPFGRKGGALPGRSRGGWRDPRDRRGITAADMQPLTPASLALGGTARPSPREAVLLSVLVRHPELIDRHLDALMDLEIGNRDFDMLRSAMVDLASQGGADHAEQFAATLERSGHGERLSRLSAAMPPGVWWAEPGAHVSDAETGFLHTLALHRKAHALHKDLREAERALGNDMSEENFARLSDIQHQLRAVEGTEATIEGFGAFSGRGARTL